ncbi:MAG TPA: hypothetical protein VJ976_01985 [Ornithinimicrobium sp.]|uniref:hypothetical protein n=1 Tax=Ornithinimicrobium sp. TaxID=1977084 RepID=UPI002B495445|nr:hypothetical protein [Ornithinimicrobium sp.]HKJ11138.1 hypothetical protein [Ornithinimicrobium sp.]
MNQEQDPRVDREHVTPVGARRRGPRMVPFLVTGALIGLILGVVLSVSGPSSQVASPGQEVVVMAGAGALVGGFVAAVLYLIAEWSSLRRM